MLPFQEPSRCDWMIPAQVAPTTRTPSAPGVGAQFQPGGPHHHHLLSDSRGKRRQETWRPIFRERGQHPRPCPATPGSDAGRGQASSPGAPSPAPGAGPRPEDHSRNFIQNGKYLKILFSGSNGDNPEKQETLILLFVWIFFSLSPDKGNSLSIRAANFHQAAKHKALEGSSGP